MGKPANAVKKKPQYTDERGREYFFDNAKFILIVLVVLAHSIAPMKPDHDTAKAIWAVINSFHMACFIFVSGYFSKSYIKKDGDVKIQRLFTYIMYYLFAQAGVYVFKCIALHEVDKLTVLVPLPALWYLMCMVLWYTVLPYVAKFKPLAVIVGTFALGLLIGYDTKSGGLLSINRAVTHFPFFMMGYYFKKEWLFKFRNKWTQLAAALIFAGFLVFAYFNYGHIAGRILECSYNYYSCKLVHFKAVPLMWINRLIYYIAAAVLCASFLLLVPRTKMFFTRFGARTLQVYIIHRLLYFCETEFEWFKLPFFDSFGVYKMMAVAVAVTFILSLKPFEYPFILIGKIKCDRFLKPEYRAEPKKQSK